MYYTCITYQKPLPMTYRSQQMHFTIEFVNLPHLTSATFLGHNINLKVIASCAGPVPDAKPYFRSYSHTSPLILFHSVMNLQYTHSQSLSSSTHRGQTCVSWRASAVLLYTQDRSQPNLMTVTFPQQGLADKTGLRVTTNTAVLSPAP